jgi:hypothetical protein
MTRHLPALLLATTLLGQLPAIANTGVPGADGFTERSYTGVAQLGDGSVAYREFHRARFDAAGRILAASTEYRGPDGDLLAVLRSDFSASLTAPSHTYEYLPTGEAQGIRVEDNGYLLFKQLPGEPEAQRSLADDFAPDALVVGCQGLHYYLRENLQTLRERGRVPIKFLFPGKLDYYNFEMRYAGTTDDGHVNIDIVIKNPFLRLFAPSLNVVYDSRSGDLLTYTGLSNITDERGKLQKVTIEYSYEAV